MLCLTDFYDRFEYPQTVEPLIKRYKLEYEGGTKKACDVVDLAERMSLNNSFCGGSLDYGEILHDLICAEIMGVGCTMKDARKIGGVEVANVDIKACF